MFTIMAMSAYAIWGCELRIVFASLGVVLWGRHCRLKKSREQVALTYRP